MVGGQNRETSAKLVETPFHSADKGRAHAREPASRADGVVSECHHSSYRKSCSVGNVISIYRTSSTSSSEMMPNPNWTLNKGIQAIQPLASYTASMTSAAHHSTYPTVPRYVFDCLEDSPLHHGDPGDVFEWPQAPFSDVPCP